MTPSKNVIDIIKQMEGFRNKSYQDVVGVWTVGYGSTRINGKPVSLGMTCTEEEAVQYILDELSPVAERITKMVTVPLTQNQFDSLCDFAYNLGSGALQGSTLMKRLNLKDYEGAANEFAKWNKAGGKVLNGLVKRRELERKLFLSQE
jgi:lysozyme